MNLKTNKRSNAYKSHDPELKRIVSQTGNIDLATNRGVPRTTAIYWAKNSKQSVAKSMQSETYLNEEIKSLKQLLIFERAKVQFISKMAKYIYIIKNNKRSILKSIKNKIIKEIDIYKKYCSINELLSLIGLHISRYYKWKSEVEICANTKKKECGLKRLNQLTGDEVSKIIKLASSKKYNHFSLTSLWKFALRHKIVICSRDTWFKYINLYSLRRTKINPKKQKYKDGLRVSKPNVTWHLDLTEFELESGQKIYLQSIIDNFSRYIG
jgi:hypothetical protein